MRAWNQERGKKKDFRLGGSIYIEWDNMVSIFSEVYGKHIMKKNLWRLDYCKELWRKKKFPTYVWAKKSNGFFL
jgi:hypothetical protein